MSNGETGNPPDLESFAQAIAGAFSTLGDFTFLKVSPTNWVAEAIALVLAIPLKLMGDLIVLAATILVDVLEQVRAQTDNIAGVALSEVFGHEVNVGSVRSGPGSDATTQLGASILQNLVSASISGGEGAAASAAPAEHFLGELLGLSVRGWLLEVITDLLPESVRIAPFNNLIEGVLHSLGIGRLTRVALQPAIKAAIADPLSWKILNDLRPTLLSEGQAVKAFIRGKHDAAWLDQELGYKGYSASRIEDLINEAELRISTGDVSLLVRHGVWDRGQGEQYLRDQGYPQETASTLLDLDTIRQLDALRGRFIAVTELRFKRQEITADTFITDMRNAGVEQTVLDAWRQILEIEMAAGFKELDKAQLDAALRGSVISTPEWRQGLATLGYNDDQITILELVEQGAVASKEEAAVKKAAQKAQVAADRAAAKQAATDARAAKAAAAAKAKADAAQAKIVQQQQHAQTLLEKQALLAKQAQQRRDQIAAAAAQKLITVAEAQRQVAGVTLAEQQAAEAVKAQGQIQSTTAADQTKLDAAQLAAQAAAVAAVTAASDATALADNQAAALAERRQERIAFYQAERDKVDQELADGLISQNAHDKQLAQLAVQETAARKAENLDQLSIARARKQAEKTSAVAATKAAKSARAVSLIPTATARKTAVIASTAAQLAQVKATSGSTAAAAKAHIAIAQASAIQTATSQLDALNAQLEAELLAFEQAHGPGAGGRGPQ